MKICNNCNETKPYEEFPKKSSTKDGYYGFCKICKAIKDKKYRDTNKEMLVKKSIKYRNINKEKIAKRNKDRYHSLTPEKVMERKNKKREYNKNAPEAVKKRKQEYDKKYFSSEAGKITTAKSAHKRRAQKISTEDGTVTSQALEELKISQNHKCAYCKCELDFSSKGKVHLDHILPLSKGGHHSISNVTWSCSSCNLRKSDPRSGCGRR